MTYRRAFRLGDRIRVGEVFGDVTEIRLQVTHLRTLQNEEVVVPNSSILNSNVVNYSALARSTACILHTTVGIGYETPWRQVEAMLLLAARAHARASRASPRRSCCRSRSGTSASRTSSTSTATPRPR